MLIKLIFQLLIECYKIYFMYLHFIWTKNLVHVHVAQLLKILFNINMLIKLVTVKKKLSGSITSKNVKSLLFICGFRLNSKQDLQKYGQIILDFSYFNNSIEVEKKIETNPVINIEYYY